MTNTSHVALSYVEKGWSPIPVPFKSKGPRGNKWQHTRVTLHNVHEHFNGGPQNIGVLLGSASGGLTDVDLDCIEAVKLAPHLLPPTPAVFGRPSKPRSHFLYVIDDPVDRASIKLIGADGDTIIELRIGGGKKGCQTIFPGSTHVSGEAIDWASEGTPAKSSFAALKAAVTKIAVGVVLSRAWPGKGSRHDSALALGGFLSRAGWAVDDITTFVELVADLAGSEDPKARAQDAADAAEARARGENVWGLPGLIDHFGKETAEKVAKLLDYRERMALGETTPELDPIIDKMNQEYALVIVGDKAVVMSIAPDGSFSFLTSSAFKLWFANKYVSLSGKKIIVSEYWLHHQRRRQYKGLRFSPRVEVTEHFNLWRGLAVEPREGDCSKFLAHLRDNVCRGHEKLFAWVAGWFAHIIQHPDSKAGTSLVIRGKQGVGKTKVGEVIGSLLGSHYVPVSDPRYVTGRFNSHLTSCLLLHADEAFWAGDRAAEGKLKDLVTGKDHLVEFKGKDSIRIANYVRLFVTGNPDWIVPAGLEERRFAVLDVGELHIQDGPYFAAIDAEMEHGGREALLHYLINFDLNSVNLREIPKTAALLEQKISSLNSEQSWWMDTLWRGELPWGYKDQEKNTCPVSRLMDVYIDHAKRQGVRRRSIETQIGIFLKGCIPGLERRKSPDKNKEYVYAFPELKACRASFDKRLGQNVEWPENDAWVIRDTDHDPPM